jgi:hypothetical protein
MTTLDPQAIRLLNHLHRGGDMAYLWGVLGAAKTSHWFPVGRPAQPFNSQHNNYFGVHPCTAIPPANSKGKTAKPEHVRSQLAYIAAINCLFAEFDAKHFDGGKPAALAHIEALDPPPSVVVDSGGGYHAYWLLDAPYLLSDDAARDRADHTQKGWVQRVGSDDGAKDLARVLRVPGTQNFKPEYGPDFPTVQFVWCDFGLLYAFDELAALVPPAPAPKERTPRKAAERSAGNQDETGSAGADFDTIAAAAHHLKRLAAWRRDKYNEWIRVGMALRELGSIGYELWEKWSKLSGKYQPGDCRDKWQTFKPGDECDGVTLDSLARWADLDDPDGRAYAGGDVVPRADYDRVKAERDELKQRVIWEQKILNCEGIKPTEKGVFVGMYDIIAANRRLGGNDGRVPLNYEHVANVLKTSKSTVGRAVEIGEQIGLWRRDPETTEGVDGSEIKHMRLELQPAYDDPRQAVTVERKQHGGARPGSGRKPKCKECPPGTVHRQMTERTVTYFCPVHGALGEPEVLPPEFEDYMPDSGAQEEVVSLVPNSLEAAPAAVGNQDDTGSPSAIGDRPQQPTWEEINLHQAELLEAQGQFERAEFLRRAVIPVAAP